MENTYRYKLINYKAKLSDIGVIIIAFRRKTYIVEAIRSVLEQVVNGVTYQITIVKNFLDKEIDEFINENGLNNIYTDNFSLGYKILLGTILTNSPVICLLEDDDMFSKNKINNVYIRFNKNNRLIYYHNSMTPINEEGNKIMKWYKQENKTVLYNDFSNLKTMLRIIKYGGHNLSSISISRNLILNNVKMFIDSTYALDYGMLLLAFSSGKSLLSDGEELTYYRVHNSAIHIVNAEYTEFINNKRQLSDGEIETLHNLNKFIDANNKDLVNIYHLMLYQHLLRRSFITFSTSNISLIEYIGLSKYAYNIKDYVKYIPLIFLQPKMLGKFKNNLIKIYIKNFLLKRSMSTR